MFSFCKENNAFKKIIRQFLLFRNGQFSLEKICFVSLKVHYRVKIQRNWLISPIYSFKSVIMKKIGGHVNARNLSYHFLFEELNV